MIYILYDIIVRLVIASLRGAPPHVRAIPPAASTARTRFGTVWLAPFQTHKVHARHMSLSFRRGNRSQRDEDTAVTIAELKHGQDKLVELVQVSVRTACPLSSLPPTNPCTHTHARTHILHVCHRKTRHPGLVITRASTVSCGRSRRSRVRS